MWATARAKLREWYIVVIGICLIAGGFFLASHQPSPSAPSVTAQAGIPPGSGPAAPAPQPLAAAKPPAASATAEQTPASAPPAVTANVPGFAAQSSPPPAHQHGMTHTMAAADAQTNAPAATVAPTAGGDPAAGRLVFRKCQACHSMEPGKTMLGPSLAAIIGRKAGSEAAYNYSPAMKQANIIWDAKTLEASSPTSVYARDPLFD
jgi:nitrite reductase (NO-forming)